MLSVPRIRETRVGPRFNFYSAAQGFLPIGDGEAELLDVGIVVEVGLADEVVDLALAVRRRARRRLDHRRRLHVCQLLDAPLAGHDVAHLQRQVRVLVLLAHLKKNRTVYNTPFSLGIETQSMPFSN